MLFSKFWVWERLGSRILKSFSKRRFVASSASPDIKVPFSIFIIGEIIILSESTYDLKDKITEEEYRTEILGEWIGDEDAYFDYELVESCIADYDLVDPMKLKNGQVWGGVDWAARGRDDTVIMFVNKLYLQDLDPGLQGSVFIVPYFEAYRKTNYTVVIERVIELSKHLHISNMISEVNGIGDMPSQTLEKEGIKVEGLFTTAQNKVNGYGRMKILMQSKRLFIPREPELIKQLTNLRYTISESGASMSIAHSKQYPRDDYCDALMFALLACDDLDIDKDSSSLDTEKVKQVIKERGLRLRKAPPMFFILGGDDFYDRGIRYADQEDW